MDINDKPDAGVTDENDQGHRKAGTGIENEIPSKKRTQKSYMQPTISAASKAVAPKKKVLGDRNEDTESVSSDTGVRKSQVLESKSGIPQNADKGMKPYDPLTNYLSPRPKFLRYNPDRRKDILVRREGEGGIELSDSFESEGGSDEDGSSVGGGPGSLASSPRDGSVDVECDEMDEEIEDVQERSWSYRGVLKYLALFAMLLLSTLYVSSMNSPSPPPAVRAINDGCNRIQSQFVRAVGRLYGGRVVSDKSNRKFDGLIELSQEKHEVVIEDVDSGGEESYDTSSEVEAVEFSRDDEATDVVEDGNVGAADELNVAADHQGGENVVGGLGMIEEEKISDQGSYLTSLESRNFGMVVASTSLADDQEKFVFDEVSHQDLLHDAQSAFEDENEVSVEQDGEVCSEETENEDVIIKEYEEMEKNMDKGSEMTYEEASNIDILNEDVERNLWGEIVGHIKNNTFRFKAIMSSGISILVALVLGFRLMRKRSAVKKPFEPAKPSAETLTAEKCIPEIEKKKDTKNVDTFVEEETEYSIQSRSEVFEEFSSREAPSVELLGEFVFEDVSSKSLRRFSTKVPSMETGKENRQPVSSERRSRTKSRLLSAHIEPESSEFSEMSSPSYGSFTVEKKIVKIEDSGSGGVQKVITTPVRRSNRFRNRALVSP